MLLLLTVGQAGAADRTDELAYRRFTTQDGLPQLQTERVWQDQKGYIYIGTLSGFARYDGRMFTPFLKGRRENIVGFAEVEERVRGLGFRRQWIVGADDKVELRQIDTEQHWLLNNFNAYDLPDGLVLLEDLNEEQRRLCHINTEGFQIVTKGGLFDQMTPDRKLYVDSTGIYIPTPQGLYHAKRDKAVRLSEKQDFYSLRRTSKGQLLAFAADGIYTIQGNRLNRVMNHNWPEADYGLLVRERKAGELLIADAHSLYLYDGNSVTTLTSGINLIKDLFVDRWDRVWLATYQGLYCYFHHIFKNHTLKEASDISRALAATPDGHVVEGTLNGSLLVDGQEVNRQDGNFYAPSAAVVNNDVYLVGQGDVIRYQNGQLEWLHLPADRYQFIAEALSTVIIGSRRCILSYDPSNGSIDTLSTEIPHPWCAAADNHGQLWVGSSFGLFCCNEEGKTEKIDYPQKLVITTMVSDQRGNIFFASADSLFMVREGKVEQLTPQMPELCGHEIRAVHVSPRGYLVIAAIDGLFVSRISQDYQISETQYYDQTNGFTILEPLKAMMAEEANGTVWVAGVEQTASFQPAQLLEIARQDTFIAPPLRWWQLWWVWVIIAVIAGSVVAWLSYVVTKSLARQKMTKIQRENLEREKLICTIRKEVEKDLSDKNLVTRIKKLTEEQDLQRLRLRFAKGILVVNVSDILYCKGERNYTQIVTSQYKERVNSSLAKIEKELEQQLFVRADRSTIVNLSRITRIEEKGNNYYCVFMSEDGSEISVNLRRPAVARLQRLL